MTTQRRLHRVSEQVRSILAWKLLNLGDPRFALVTITSVRVNADMSIAKVYWSVSGGKKRIDDVTNAFEAARGLFKRELAEGLGTRIVPQIKFFYDDTLDVVADSARLLSRAHVDHSSEEEAVGAKNAGEE